jgi:hypothetical protein
MASGGSHAQCQKSWPEMDASNGGNKCTKDASKKREEDDDLSHGCVSA